PLGLGVPRSDHAAVHLGPRQLGRDRRAHDGEPGPPRARLRPLDARGLQERHGRRRPDRDRRRALGGPPPPLLGRHGAGPGGHRLDAREPRRSRHPARGRRWPELRRDQRAEDARRAPRRRPPTAAHDRHEPRQQRQGRSATAAGRARGRGAGRPGRGRDRRRDAGILHRGWTPGPPGPEAPRVRSVHHRRLHGLGDDGARAPRACRGRAGAARRARVAGRALDYDRTPLPAIYARARELPAEALATWRRALADMLPPSPAIRRVVDLGCGTGRFTGLLADLYGTAVVGVEPSHGMLAGREPLDPGRAGFLAAAAEALPLAAGAIDLVFLSLVYHHFRAPSEAVAELGRVVRPGGHALVRQVVRESVDAYEHARFFPEARALDLGRMPSRDGLARTFLAHEIEGD